MADAPDGRRIHYWRGQDRRQDTAAFAEAIVAAVELFNRGGAPVQLDGNGKLIDVNFAMFRELVDKHICGMRVINRDGIWQREYFTYRFDPPRRHDPTISGPQPEPDQS